MKLFIVHVGYYDNEIGIYELHTNFVAAADSVIQVKKLVKEKEIFQKKNMHIDAVQEIEMVDGYKVTLVKDVSDTTKLINYNYTQIKEVS